MKTVNERNRAVLHVSFRDLDGELTAPQNVSYRIDDQASGTEIRDWTNLSGTMASSMDIPLTSVDNAMVDPSRPTERRVVTVRADYDGEDDEALATGQYTYEVKNLRFLT